ncbi:hypothetical protein CIPOMA221M_12940 [Citrobacter portucalensis]|uniref:hypothetical protein n=1 Tax=Citrobacter portucalensis TaxID=1639133 RepID=UPI003B2414EB
MNQQEPSIDELLRKAIRRTLEEIAAQPREGWRQWIPPATATLVIYASGMITGAAIIQAVLR